MPQIFSTVYAKISDQFNDGQRFMDDNFDSAIQEVTEIFEKVPTTEDTRTGIDRRHQEAKEFPLKDRAGNLVAEDRRQGDRRNSEVDIDDISEYVSEIH